MMRSRHSTFWSVAIVLAAAVWLVPVAGFGEGPDASGGTPSGAAEGSEAASATDGEAETPAVPPAARETSIHGGWLVIVSYIVLWLGLLGYIAYLGSRQRRLAGELDELEDRIDETLGTVDEED